MSGIFAHIILGGSVKTKLMTVQLLASKSSQTEELATDVVIHIRWLLTYTSVFTVYVGLP